VDNGDNARDLDAAVRQVGKPLGILVEVDVGQGRTGVTSEDAAVALARSIDDAPNLTYRGIQAYYGHLQHVPAYVDRLAKAREQWGRVERIVRALKEAGFAPGIISGGGTGSHHLDLADGPFTEIQPGSYLFMDRQYGDIEIDPNGTPPFVTSFSIQAQIVSANHPDRAIINAGFKAMATDAGPPDFLAGAPEQATYQFMGDEHGGVMYAGPPAHALRLRDVVRLRAPHCDPTVNLHEFLHVVDGDTLVDVWPIDGRGY
jgi:D-serine deaminase-like pyridoxal phosphate-dependent protein